MPSLMQRSRVGFKKLEVITDVPDGVRSDDWTDENVNGVEFMGRSRPPPTPGEKGQKRLAAVAIQRWFRKQMLKYSVFGPMIFTKKDGKIAEDAAAECGAVLGGLPGRIKRPTVHRGAGQAGVLLAQTGDKQIELRVLAAFDVVCLLRHLG